jgi:hypothetical protein
MVSDLVARSVRVLRLPISDVDPATPLRNAGLDSLMASNSGTSSRIGPAPVPLVARRRAEHHGARVMILGALVDAGPEGEPSKIAAQRPPPNVDDLSDENVDALLRRMLAER